MSYPGHLFVGWGSYLSAEMQSVYSAAPADWESLLRLLGLFGVSLLILTMLCSGWASFDLYIHRSLFRAFGDPSKSSNYNWYHQLHVPLLCKLSGICLIFSFSLHFHTVIRRNNQIHPAANILWRGSLSFFFFFFLFLWLILDSVCQPRLSNPFVS